MVCGLILKTIYGYNAGQMPRLIYRRNKKFAVLLIKEQLCTIISFFD